ncbi:restriction endonuclease subunit S [Limosilactobacillus reuteri]|uniref:restriction endonuclease subunit S n=2 Tax=Limosilactobacillus reuteri TaxID=1598 RepID=UPI000D703253|nr:restriction endonuclease subunit S [Limosilactobacillus reuteri]MCT3202880.1 restriction endonuclease subunit S [Limosilactobacillus reuteri]MCT3211445.1 restriction endonuclease subunit S [Limosilactobacillus reuteri]PWT56038.1 restriction endonuclease subunit S [Limosilactobacillus reuteri]PWT67560.1 restriction endonuclease subunit S [Limosilactobacillus reuteri]TSB18760.1 restriction endonuclease subunit S [Limosilactobacillus reuteri]
MDKKPEKLVPEVRFKGFTDDWEQHKLGETLTGFEYGLNTPATDYDGINKYLRITDIDDVSHKFDISHLTSPKLKDDNYLLANGDILFARTGASVGKSYRYSNIDGKVYYAGFLIKAHIKDHFSTNFIFDTTLLPRYHYFVQVTSMRSGQPGINAKEYQKYIIYTPSESEQNKISDLILTIQKLIDLQQRKLEQLKQLKKAMLQQLFVNKNNKQPNLRFKNFNGDWEERKLSDIANYRNGKAHEQYIDMNGIYTVVNSKFISTNGKVKKFSNEPIELLKKGEIAFVLSDVPNGKALAKAYLIDSDNKYSLNQRIAGISPSSDINSYFLYVLMNRNRYFLKFDDGVGQTNLSKKDIEEFKENYPLFDEQQKIANLFSQIQTLISLQQNKHTQLIALKKYLLQKLFI